MRIYRPTCCSGNTCKLQLGFVKSFEILLALCEKKKKNLMELMEQCCARDGEEQQELYANLLSLFSVLAPVDKCVWVWVCASWPINIAHETFGQVTESAGSLHQRGGGRVFFFLSECQDQSAATQRAAPASSAPSASHRRGRSARKHREVGADGSFCLWVKTTTSFLSFGSASCCVCSALAQLESGTCSD